MSNIKEFKSKGVQAKEALIKNLRWLADAIESGEEFDWAPETAVVSVSSPTNIPVFYVFGDDTPIKTIGLLEMTKEVAVAQCFMNAEAPPEGPEV